MTGPKNILGLILSHGENEILARDKQTGEQCLLSEHGNYYGPHRTPWFYGQMLSIPIYDYYMHYRDLQRL